MDDQIAEVEQSADVDCLMAGIDELLARSLAIMTQREPSASLAQPPLREERQASRLVEA